MSATPAVPRVVGVSLAAIQFFFALSWTVYVIFLPQLAAQAGVAKSALPYILMLDQLVFLVCDYAVGVASDRAVQVLGRLGLAVMVVTVLSCLAFVSLPFVAPAASPALFLALTVVWAATSSVLRAPPLTLVGRYAAKPSQPGLVAVSLLGLGVAGAIAPYVAVHLRELDPRWPFVLSSLALALVTGGLVLAERLLSRGKAGAGMPAVTAGVPPSQASGSASRPKLWVGLLGGALLAALAFQAHVFVNSAPLYLRFASASDLQWLMPVFWVGFNLALWPAGVATRRFGGVEVMGTAAAVAAAAAWGALQSPNLYALLLAQAVAGVAWAGVLISAFATALELGKQTHGQRGGSQGRYVGALSSVLALAALCRIGALAAQWPVTDTGRQWLPFVAGLGWLLAGVWMLWPRFGVQSVR